MIKAVIFDCFGVLTTDTWKLFLESLPENIDVKRLRELNRQLDASFITIDSFLQEVHEVTGRYPTEIEKLINNEITKDVGLLDDIRELRKKNLKIGLLSNVSSNWIRSTFLTAEEQTLFNDMVFSFEVRLTKPDRAIFELACERLDVDLREAIFVDDSMFNCEAAKSFGMRAICYETFSQYNSEIKELLATSDTDQ